MKRHNMDLMSWSTVEQFRDNWNYYSSLCYLLLFANPVVITIVRMILSCDISGSILRIIWTLQHSPLLSSPPLHSPPIPLEVGPLNPSRGPGGAVSSPSGVWGGAEFWTLVHFSLKIWHLVATVLMIFLRINWPNAIFQSWTPHFSFWTPHFGWTARLK